MSSFYYTRERERSPYYDDTDSYYARPLIRRNSKRQRVDIYDDDEYNDYPSASAATPSKPSRALTIRQPSQLQKYNVYNVADLDRKVRHRDFEDDHGHSYRTVKYHVSRPSESDNERDEREFRLKVKATFGRPKSSHTEKAMAWSGDMFKRKEKWEQVDWESRERPRRDSFWDDEQPVEKEYKYRKIKRTRTDEWKPLSGFRRF